MPSFNFTQLLRRTTVALASVSAFTVAGHAAAQTITLSGSTSNNCPFSTMTVQNNGNVNVTCTGGGAQGSPGSFSVANAPAALTWNATGSWNIARSGGTTGAADVGYSIEGGCGPLPLTGTVHFDDAGATSIPMSIRTPNNDTTCTVRITSASVGTIGTPSANVVVNSTGTAPSGGGGGGGGGSTPTSFPVTAGCSAQPLDLMPFSIEYRGVGSLSLAGSQIATSALPNLSAPLVVNGVQLRGALTSAQAILGVGPASPLSSIVEISINRCPGVIDSSVGACYMRMANPQFEALTWVDRPTNVFPDKATATAYGVCPAYLSDSAGPYYVNVRYNYSPTDCANAFVQGGTGCGFKQSYNVGSY